MNKRKNDNSPLKIAVLGHKTIPSRQGGIEIVVEDEAADYICQKYNWDDVTERTVKLYRN